MIKKIISILSSCLFTATLLAFVSNDALANPPKKNVNILQWWGYLDRNDPYIKKIETECNVNNLIPLSSNNFTKLYDNINFVATNTPEKLINKPNFAFSYQWSGDAIKSLRNHKDKLKYLIHPKLSYITSDLIANLNDKQSTICVAKKLVSRRFLEHEQNVTYYFSPYPDNPNINNTYFNQIHKQWLTYLNELPWMISVNAQQFRELGNSWERVKLELALKQRKSRNHEKH